MIRGYFNGELICFYQTKDYLPICLADISEFIEFVYKESCRFYRRDISDMPVWTGLFFDCNSNMYKKYQIVGKILPNGSYIEFKQ